MSQLPTRESRYPLFSLTQEAKPSPPTNGTRTSAKAAEKIAPHCSGLRKRVLQHIESCGLHGCTDKEGQLATGILGDTWRPRRGECAEAGWIVEAGVTRNGCEVWVVKR